MSEIDEDRIINWLANASWKATSGAREAAYAVVYLAFIYAKGFDPLGFWRDAWHVAREWANSAEGKP